MKIVLVAILVAIAAVSQVEPLPTVGDELQADPQRWAPIRARIKGWRKKYRPRELENENVNDQLMTQREEEDKEVDEALADLNAWWFPGKARPPLSKLPRGEEQAVLEEQGEEEAVETDELEQRTETRTADDVQAQPQRWKPKWFKKPKWPKLRPILPLLPLVPLSKLAVGTQSEQQIETRTGDDGNVQAEAQRWKPKWRPKWPKLPKLPNLPKLPLVPILPKLPLVPILPKLPLVPILPIPAKRSWRTLDEGLANVEDQAQLLEERATEDGQNNLLTSNAEAMPEANNYDVVEDSVWCICGKNCCDRRGVSDVVQTDGSDDGLPEIIVLGSQTELKLYSDPSDLLALYKSPVARAELVSRPLDPATPGQVSDALGGLQHAVVATLTDGRRFLVVKGNQKGEGSETIVILADHMTDDWTKVATKDVSQSTLMDLVNAGGKGFDVLEDNGKHAASRMMALL